LHHAREFQGRDNQKVNRKIFRMNTLKTKKATATATELAQMMERLQRQMTKALEVMQSQRDLIDSQRGMIDELVKDKG
tara:strand:- start:2495 stop:2728 length:234 start_codon:yes stop_codon:yes gene_type:complete